MAVVPVARFGFAATTEELYELRHKVDQFVGTQQKNYQDLAQAINAVNEMKQEFQSIRGQLESSDHLMKQSEKLYQDLDTRVSALEDKIGQLYNLLQEIKTSRVANPVSVVPGTTSGEHEEFQAYLARIQARDFTGAIAGFSEFLKKYPQSEEAGSAQFWIADSYYGVGDYAKAISEFQTLVDKYPQHLRAKEGVYKQALSFLKLKKYPEAKLFFQKVIASYPGSAEALQAKGKLIKLEEDEKKQTTPPMTVPKAETSHPVMKPNSLPGAIKPAPASR